MITIADYSNPFNNLESEAGADDLGENFGVKRGAILNRMATSVIRVAVILIIGVILISSIGNGVSEMLSGGLNIYFSNNPEDGDTVTVDSYTFEFDYGDGVSVGHITVPIEATTSGTATNLKTALETVGYTVR